MDDVYRDWSKSVSIIILTRRYLTSLGVRPNTKQLSFLGVPWTATYDDMSCKYCQYYAGLWWWARMFLSVWSVVRHVVTLLVVIVRHHPRYCPARYSLRILPPCDHHQTPPLQHRQINILEILARQENNKGFPARFYLNSIKLLHTFKLTFKKKNS